MNLLRASRLWATAVNERRVALGNNSPIDFNVNTDESGNTVTKQYPVESDLYGLPIRGYERDWPDYIGCEKLFDAIAGAAVALKNIDVNLVPLDNKLQRDPWDGIDALAANHDIDYTDSDSLNIYNADAWRFLKELLDYWVYVRLKPDIDLVSYKWRNGSRDNNAQTAWAYKRRRIIFHLNSWLPLSFIGKLLEIIIQVGILLAILLKFHTALI